MADHSKMATYSKMASVIQIPDKFLLNVGITKYTTNDDTDIL